MGAPNVVKGCCDKGKEGWEKANRALNGRKGAVSLGTGQSSMGGTEWKKPT